MMGTQASIISFVLRLFISLQIPVLDTPYFKKAMETWHFVIDQKRAKFWNNMEIWHLDMY